LRQAQTFAPILILLGEPGHQTCLNPGVSPGQPLGSIDPPQLGFDGARLAKAGEELVRGHADALVAIDATVFAQDLLADVKREHGVANPSLFEDLLAIHPSLRQRQWTSLSNGVALRKAGVDSSDSRFCTRIPVARQ